MLHDDLRTAEIVLARSLARNCGDKICIVTSDASVALEENASILTQRKKTVIPDHHAKDKCG